MIEEEVNVLRHRDQRDPEAEPHRMCERIEQWNPFRISAMSANQFHVTIRGSRLYWSKTFMVSIACQTESDEPSTV